MAQAPLSPWPRGNDWMLPSKTRWKSPLYWSLKTANNYVISTVQATTTDHHKRSYLCLPGIFRLVCSAHSACSQLYDKYLSQEESRQDSLVWVFGLFFFDFLHHGRGDIERHRLCKPYKKSRKEKLVEWATEVARLYGVSIQNCTWNQPSPNVHLRSRDKILLCNHGNRLEYLHETWQTCSSWFWLQKLPQILKLLPRELGIVFQIRKKRAKNHHRILNDHHLIPWQKNEKMEAEFCRSALFLWVCENRFSLQQFFKKWNLTERGVFFIIWCPKVITIAHALKSCVIFHILQELSKN